MSSQRDPRIDELDQVAGGKLGSISTAGTSLMLGSAATGRAYQNTESGQPEASLKFRRHWVIKMSFESEKSSLEIHFYFILDYVSVLCV